MSKYKITHTDFSSSANYVNLKTERKILKIKGAFKITDEVRVKEILYAIDNDIPIYTDEDTYKEFVSFGLHGTWESMEQISRREEENRAIEEWERKREEKLKLSNEWYSKLSEEAKKMVDLDR